MRPLFAAGRTIREWTWTPSACLAGLLLLAGGGCAASKTPREGLDFNQLDDATFLAYLADEPEVSVAEAYRAMLILADGQDGGQDFQERQSILEERGIARPAWGLEPERVIDRGSLSYMVCRILRYRGGIDRIIFGTWGLGDRRYAHRELVHRKLLDPGSLDYQPVTGGLLIGLLAKADAEMASRRLYESRGVDLGPEPPAGQPVGSPPQQR